MRIDPHSIDLGAAFLAGAGAMLVVVGVGTVIYSEIEKRKIARLDHSIVQAVTEFLDSMTAEHSVDIHETFSDGVSMGMHAHCICGAHSELSSMDDPETEPRLKVWQSKHMAEHTEKS